jgi:hypothetical protein
MALHTTESFTGGDLGYGAGTSKEVIYMNYLLSTLTEARQSFKTGDTQLFNLYCQFLKSSVLNGDTRNIIDKEVLEEEKRLKKIGYDEKYIEFMLGFIIVKHIMAYINDTMELEHEDIVGEVGKLDEDYEDEIEERESIHGVENILLKNIPKVGAV